MQKPSFLGERSIPPSSRMSGTHGGCHWAVRRVEENGNLVLKFFVGHYLGTSSPVMLKSSIRPSWVPLPLAPDESQDLVTSQLSSSPRERPLYPVKKSARFRRSARS